MPEIIPNVPTGITAGTPDLPGILNKLGEFTNRSGSSTGWRNIKNLIGNGWLCATARIRRDGPDVTLEIAGLDGSSATGPLLFAFGSNPATQVSANFAPEAGAWRSPVFESATAGYRCHFYGNGSSGLSVSFSEGGTGSLGAFTLQVSWRTWRAWPNFLPPEA